VAEDRFANVFSAEVVMTGANVLTFVEMNFGITLRDRVAIVIDQLWWFPTASMITEMTSTGDLIRASVGVSDQPTTILPDDRRFLSIQEWHRLDFGTAAGGQILEIPTVQTFFPPLIALPNRLFLGLITAGLASAGTMRLRMHFRTVSITQDQQLVEVLESFQLST